MEDIKEFPEKDDLYRCYACKGVFTAGRSKREFNIYHEILFEREVKQEDCVIVCDQCFKKLYSHLKRNGVV